MRHNAPMAAKILVIDNYDSFVFNLVQYLQQLGAECTVKYCAEHSIPLFGVCLGHQAIGVAFGATVSRAPELLHGKTSLVYHKQEGVLADIPSPFTATRYHSLCVEKDSVPNTLHITGSTDSGLVMSMEHTTLPIQGVQFHPESVLTEHGHHMLANWLVMCGDKGARERAVGLSPVVSR